MDRENRHNASRDPALAQAGRRFRVAREAVGLTQAAAAAALGVHPTVLSRYENGVWFPRVGTVRKLAALYGTTVDALIGNADSADTNEAEAWPEGVQFIRRASKDLTPEAKQAIIRAMEAILEMDRKARDKDKDGGPR